MEFNKEQRKIINSKPNGHMLIKGEKGTGKTIAFINKIPSLLNNYCIYKDDRILIAAYNDDCLKNLEFFYENIEGEKYHQNSFFDQDNSDKLEISTIDSLMLDHFNQYNKKLDKKITIASSLECKNQLVEAIKVMSKKYDKKNTTILDLEYIQFIQEEVMWIKSCNYTQLEEYQNANRIGRANKLNGKILRKNSKHRQAIYETLVEYNNNLNKINKIDYQDMAIIALKNASKKYTHIFIDDTQNLTRVQLEFLKALYNEKAYSSITFILDNSQNTHSQAWITKGRSFASLGYDMKGKCVSLNKSYNDTQTILEKIEEFEVMKNELAQNYNIQKNDVNTTTLNLNTIEYIDLKHNISHKFIKDSGSLDEIYIEDNGIEEKVEDIINIPVFNEIAAGSPILMNDYVEDNYSLPKEWIKSPKDTFILKVKGNSMINKNIHNGDYVVISKQKTPSVRDIVAVDIEGEATLKTYKNVDGKIVLMPENENYEPIIIEDQQFNFLGVAIGLVKNS